MIIYGHFRCCFSRLERLKRGVSSDFPKSPFSFEVFSVKESESEKGFYCVNFKLHYTGDEDDYLFYWTDFVATVCWLYDVRIWFDYIEK